MTEGGDGGLLDAMAPLLRVRPILDDYCRFGGAWAAAQAPAGDGAAHFHLLIRGSCRVRRPGHPEIRLSPGDVLLLPHGDAHAISGDGRAPAVLLPDRSVDGIRLRSTPAEPDTELVCGRLVYDAGADSTLIAALPDQILLRRDDAGARPAALVGDIGDELAKGAPGAGAVAGHLASALLVLTLRAGLALPATTGIAALVSDRATARLARALLADPARPWSLDDMAAVAAMSRASLVRRVRQRAGTSPAALLADLRLDIARQRIAGGSTPLARIAGEVGYGSEDALSRAILRRFGVRPGALRGGGDTV